MIRNTSVLAYNQIKEEGLLSKMRFYVYDLIFQHGPVNISQLIKISEGGGSGIINTGSISGRISELVDRGVIEEDYTGKCPLTGRQTIFWRITNSLPIELAPTIERKREFWILLDNTLWFSAGDNRIFCDEKDAIAALNGLEGFEMIHVQEVRK